MDRKVVFGHLPKTKECPLAESFGGAVPFGLRPKVKELNQEETIFTA